MRVAAEGRVIFDVGMHTGRDTEYYLKKGFRVVAVEANPRLVDLVSKRLRSHIAEGALKIYPVAIGAREGRIPFFLNRQKDDWGTTSEEFAWRNERAGTTHDIVEVECIRFERIVEECGIPYYLKVDIEGADVLCLEALYGFAERPRYVSIEAGLDSLERALAELAHFESLGYCSFKLVNQALNYRIKCPNPPLEGNYVPASFDGHTSGPFGEETPGPWFAAADIRARYPALVREQARFGVGSGLPMSLRWLHNALMRVVGGTPLGWYDLHAKLAPPA
jgi:FkbM family methyltransferase